MCTLGLSVTLNEAGSGEGASLNTVPALNAIYQLLQVHRRSQQSQEELECEHLKISSTLEQMQQSNSRLKVSRAYLTAISESAVASGAHGLKYFFQVFRSDCSETLAFNFT